MLVAAPAEMLRPCAPAATSRSAATDGQDRRRRPWRKRPDPRGSDRHLRGAERQRPAMARSVLAIRSSGWDVVIVHGNGPQVGNLAIQQEEGRALVPAQPLFCLGAMTQGQIGSLISARAARRRAADVTGWPPWSPRRRRRRTIRRSRSRPSRSGPFFTRPPSRRARRRAGLDGRRGLRPGLPPAWSPRRSRSTIVEIDRDPVAGGERLRSSSPRAAAACRSSPAARAARRRGRHRQGLRGRPAGQRAGRRGARASSPTFPG